MEQWSEYSYECRKGIPDWLLDGLRRGTRTLGRSLTDSGLFETQLGLPRVT